MSEPVSTAEIEDVLSSIRRLVSDNAGAGKRDEVPEALRERLVLTPAFRVDEPEAPKDDAAEEGRGVLSLVGGSWKAGAENRAEAAEPEAVAAETTLEDRIAELEAAIGDSVGEWEPDGSEDEAPPETVIFHRAAREAGRAPDAAPERSDYEAATGEAIAESAADVAQEWEDVDPRAGADRPAAAGTDPDDFDRTDEAAGEAEDETEGEAVIDEDMLRELVARMVREELQGTVGERITHNVRRMVRREIARALALKNFE